MSTNNPTIAALNSEVTALQHRIAELEQQREQFKQPNVYAPFFTGALDMLAIAGFDGYFKQLNPRWQMLLGFTPEELCAQPFIEFVHPEDRIATLKEAEKLAVEGAETIGFDNRYRTKDGSYRWLSWTAMANPQSGMLYCIARDITLEKQNIEQLTTFAEIVRNIPLGLCIYQLEDLNDARSLHLITTNPAVTQMRGGIGLTPGMLLSESSPTLYETDIPEKYANVVRTNTAINIGEIHYTDELTKDRIRRVHAFPLPGNKLGLIYEDITERKRAEESFQQLMLQEETIRAQAATLEEITTPLLTISDDVVVMPLIGTIDSRRAQLVMEALLEGVATSSARLAILDITGVSVVDTQVANALIRAAQAVKLLGAEVVLTGIRPEIAQTLVGLGVDLSGIVTRSNLQRGIAYAINATTTN